MGGQQVGTQDEELINKNMRRKVDEQKHKFNSLLNT